MIMQDGLGLRTQHTRSTITREIPGQRNPCRSHRNLKFRRKVRPSRRFHLAIRAYRRLQGPVTRTRICRKLSYRFARLQALVGCDFWDFNTQRGSQVYQVFLFLHKYFANQFRHRIFA